MPVIVTLPLIRNKRDLTQEQLAELAQRSQQLIGKLEQQKAKGIGFDTLSQLLEAVDATGIEDAIVYIPNDPTKLDDTLARLSQRFGVPVDYLLPYIPEDLKEAYRKQYTLN
ncbi:MAG: helix-turn-helix domain-containing protein [Cyanobacteria bacterium SBLK]|nr:helix-turn-helix domain-containing protein [Cyanobacteria bacterium SBLK]